MKWKLIFLTVLATVLLVAYTNNDTLSNVQEIKEIVHEYSVGQFNDETASITSEELIITNNDGKETSYTLPEDDFFVSIAPFINETHPCTYHSLTSLNEKSPSS